jgi:hypothetical protein
VTQRVPDGLGAKAGDPPGRVRKATQRYYTPLIIWRSGTIGLRRGREVKQFDVRKKAAG